MFTGIIEEKGSILNMHKGRTSASLTIGARKILDGMKTGNSIAVNGICLTVTSFTKTSFTVDVMPETMRSTSLGDLKEKSMVNLERALRLEDRMGGHMVSGHIDGIGTISSRKREDNALWLTIEAGMDILLYMVKKGSIAVDGVSLTIADLRDASFSISLIPLTQQETILEEKKEGDIVNIECDMIGKYVERFLSAGNHEMAQKKSRIDMDFLREHEFF